jgi:hypothetical protein
VAACLLRLVHRAAPRPRAAAAHACWLALPDASHAAMHAGRPASHDARRPDSRPAGAADGQLGNHPPPWPPRPACTATAAPTSASAPACASGPRGLDELLLGQRHRRRPCAPPASTTPCCCAVCGGCVASWPWLSRAVVLRVWPAWQWAVGDGTWYWRGPARRAASGGGGRRVARVRLPAPSLAAAEAELDAYWGGELLSVMHGEQLPETQLSSPLDMAGRKARQQSPENIKSSPSNLGGGRSTPDVPGWPHGGSGGGGGGGGNETSDSMAGGPSDDDMARLQARLREVRSNPHERAPAPHRPPSGPLSDAPPRPVARDMCRCGSSWTACFPWQRRPTAGSRRRRRRRRRSSAAPPSWTR